MGLPASLRGDPLGKEHPPIGRGGDDLSYDASSSATVSAAASLRGVRSGTIRAGTLVAHDLAMRLLLHGFAAATVAAIVSACGASSSSATGGASGAGGAAPIVHCSASNTSTDAGPCTNEKSGCSDGNTYAIHCLDGACSCVENGSVTGTYAGGTCADAEFMRCGWHL
jgi:hypothetical protein